MSAAMGRFFLGACPAMEPRGAFGRRLRTLMRRRGVTYSELSQGIWGTPARSATVTQWVSGRYEPSYASLRAIRDALGCTWEELMGE